MEWEYTAGTFPRARRRPTLAHAAIGAQAADLATFAVAVSALGIAAEQNPAVAAAYGLGGLLGVLALKAGYMALALGVARWAGPCRTASWLMGWITLGCSLGAACNVAAVLA